MTYTEAKTIQLSLEMRMAVAGVALRAFPKLPNGLTPDSTKLLPGYRAARIESDTAFAALRRFNGAFVKAFKNEIRDERRNRVAATSL